MRLTSANGRPSLPRFRPSSNRIRATLANVGPNRPHPSRLRPILDRTPHWTSFGKHLFGAPQHISSATGHTRRQASFGFDWRHMAADVCRHGHRRASRTTQRRQNRKTNNGKSSRGHQNQTASDQKNAPSPRASRTMAATRDDQRANCIKLASKAIGVAASPPRPLAPNIRQNIHASRHRPTPVRGEPRPESHMALPSSWPRVLAASAKPRLCRRPPTQRHGALGSLRRAASQSRPRDCTMGKGPRRCPMLLDVGTALHHDRNALGSTVRGYRARRIP